MHATIYAYTCVHTHLENLRIIDVVRSGLLNVGQEGLSAPFFNDQSAAILKCVAGSIASQIQSFSLGKNKKKKNLIFVAKVDEIMNKEIAYLLQ